MKNQKFKIIFLTLIIIAFIFIIFLQKGEMTKDFIDLRNDEVFENEYSVNDVEINSKEFVQVKFSWEVNGIKYNDALNFTKDQYSKLTEKDIEKMKEERFKNWVNLVNNYSRQETSEEINEVR